jgi:hypothetical protein
MRRDGVLGGVCRGGNPGRPGDLHRGRDNRGPSQIKIPVSGWVINEIILFEYPATQTGVVTSEEGTQTEEEGGWDTLELKKRQPYDSAVQDQVAEGSLPG